VEALITYGGYPKLVIYYNHRFDSFGHGTTNAIGGGGCGGGTSFSGCNGTGQGKAAFQSVPYDWYKAFGNKFIKTAVQSTRI